MPFQYPSLQARLLANTRKVRKPHMKTPCFQWTAKVQNSGYGVFTRRDGDRMLTLSVHKVAYLEVWNKPLKYGHDVSHLCGNPLCWAEDHLKGESHKRNCNRKGKYGQ